MSERVYPDWVQKQKTTGTTVKKVGNNYYLYKHSSKRVHGKKNPVPVGTYIGKITPEVIVKEYGFSRSVEVLDFIIVRESPESYIRQVRKVPELLNPHIQLGVQKSDNVCDDLEIGFRMIFSAIPSRY